MRRLLHLALAALAVLLLANAATARVKTGAADGAATGYVVVLNDYVASVDATVDRLSVLTGAQTTFRYYSALKGFAARLTPAQADALRADPDVQFVEADSEQHIVGTTRPIQSGETVPAGIRRIESAVHDRIRKRSSVNVAIIDTGIDFAQTDLRARNGKDCIDAEPAQDDNGHGTLVSGIVAARNQGAGLAGVSPDTTLYAVKAFGSDGHAELAEVLCGLDWVTQNAARLDIKVANMSWGGSGTDDGDCGNSNDDAKHKAICALVAAGVVAVAGAGNSHSDFATFTPAAYDEVLTSTAMVDMDGKPGGRGGSSCRTDDQDDSYASFSSYASAGTPDEDHTVAAPGECVVSLALGGGTTVKSGTSLSTAHVTGTVANCMGHPNLPGPCAGLTPAQVVQKIRADAAAKPASYGFLGDPNHGPPAGRYYGFLVSNLGY